MIERARAGKTVVRLKGGDPLVFGRAGEEIAALREAGIEVEIIPGITAGLAAAASLQIPLTHRDISHSVTFLSGHEAGGDEPSFAHLDLAALGRGENTLARLYGRLHRRPDRGPSCSKPAGSPTAPSSPSRMRAATTSAASPPPLPILPRIRSASSCKSPAVLIFGEVAGLPAAGVVDDMLSLPEVRRVYA